MVLKGWGWTDVYPGLLLLQSWPGGCEELRKLYLACSSPSYPGPHCYLTATLFLLYYWGKKFVALRYGHQTKSL